MDENFKADLLRMCAIVLADEKRRKTEIKNKSNGGTLDGIKKVDNRRHTF